MWARTVSHFPFGLFGRGTSEPPIFVANIASWGRKCWQPAIYFFCVSLSPSFITLVSKPRPSVRVTRVWYVWYVICRGANEANCRYEYAYMCGMKSIFLPCCLRCRDNFLSDSLSDAEKEEDGLLIKGIFFGSSVLHVPWVKLCVIFYLIKTYTRE